MNTEETDEERQQRRDAYREQYRLFWESMPSTLFPPAMHANLLTDELIDDDVMFWRPWVQP